MKSTSKGPLFIAELGTSHGGDRGKAAELVAAAGGAGALCVKCQIVFADEILHPKTGSVRLPGGEIPLYEAFKKLEQGPEFYEFLKDETEKQGLLFLATPFGPKSADLLKNLRPKAVKIASPELNYVQLVKEIASWDIETFISTGVSKLEDIEEALGWCGGFDSNRRGLAGEKICLLHCVTSYPAPPEDYNLRIIPALAARFGCRCGVSDHSLDPVLVPLLAASLGAAAIEKHFCLSRSDPGLDDPIALPPEDFAKMVKTVNNTPFVQAVDLLSKEYGAEKVQKCLGDGVKRLALSEEANYERTRRSLHALADIAAGDPLTPEKFAPLRTEKLLRPGLPPSWAEKITGKTAKLFIPAGEGIRLEDVAL
jgi:sialic acid synthase SpsE